MKKEIKLAKRFKTKEKYNVFIDGEDTKYCAVEKFNKGKQILFPFYIDKETKIVSAKLYGSIDRIVLEEKSPKLGLASVSKGFGFTRYDMLDSFMRYISKEMEEITEVEFVEKGDTAVIGKRLVINNGDFYKIAMRLRSLKDSHKDEAEKLYQTCGSDILNDYISKPTKYIYQQGSLKRYIEKYTSDSFALSDDDMAALKDVLINSTLTTDVLSSTRNTINVVYIEDVIEEFEKLLSQKTETKNLEEKWHQFFKKHTWIFNQIFAFPAIYFDDKVNVGGATLDGDSDKVADFLYKNKLTNNLAFLEIKTHLTDLMNKTVYRKPNVFPVSPKLTGAIVQVMDQRNKLSNNLGSKKGDSKLNSLNSSCVVVCGSVKSLNKHQKESFELFRSSNKEVIIIPFDELLEKIKLLLKIFKG